MQLIHFSDNPTLTKVVSCEPRSTAIGKPSGFWVSDENDYGWATWRKHNNFMPEGYRYKYIVTLKPTANILHLRTPYNLIYFTKKYASSKSGFLGIDWEKVGEDYQGILITPYQWPMRLDPRTFWYYSWDCASGCIWDSHAIETIKLVTQRGNYSKN